MDDVSKSALDAALARWDDPTSAGFALGVVEKGELTYARGFGVATLDHLVLNAPNTVFHAATMAMMVTAAVVVLLEKEGALSLDATLRDLLPEIRIRDASRITLRQLLTHTSGVPDQFDLIHIACRRSADHVWYEETLALVEAHGVLDFEPGTRASYSTTGYSLAVHAVEELTKARFEHVAQRLIFEPWGMTSTRFMSNVFRVLPRRAVGYERRPNEIVCVAQASFEGAGPCNLFTTVEDMARWDRHFREAMVGDEKLWKRMAVPAALADGTVLPYGLGLMLADHRGSKLIGHVGRDLGFRSAYLCFPGEDVSVVCLGNWHHIAPAAIARQVADVVRGRAPEPIRDGAGPGAEELAGIYYDEAADHAIGLNAAGDSTLWAQVEHMDFIHLVPAGPGRVRLVDEVIDWRLAIETHWQFDTDAHGRPSFVPLGIDGKPVPGVGPFRRLAMRDLSSEEIGKLSGKFRGEKALQRVIRLSGDGSALSCEEDLAGKMQFLTFENGLMMLPNLWTVRATERDADGRVTVLEVSTPRARRVRFLREDD